MDIQPKQIISFAGFELDAARRQLTLDGKPVALKSKAFDVLVYFAQNAGRIISKDEILNAVWANQFVEEANLTVQISALRRALGESKDAPRFLVTVPGKGYEFIADTETDTAEITIESHMVSRIVVQEESDDSSDILSNLQPQNFLALDKPKRPSIFRSNSLILVLITILLAGGAAMWLYDSRLQNNREYRVIAQSGEPQLTRRLFTTTNGVPQIVAISPDGSQVAYVGRFQGLDSLWIGELATNKSVQITEPSNRLYEYLTFAPDGKNLYFSAHDDNHRQFTLMRISVFGGASTDLIAGVQSEIAFSTDGKSIAFVRRDENRNSLIVADAEDGKNERVLISYDKKDGLIEAGVSWSPDNREIAVGVSDSQRKNYGILAVNAIDGTISKIGDNVWSSGINCVWLRDNSGLLVLSGENIGDAGNTQISLLTYPEGQVSKVTNDTLNYSLSSLSISDKNKLAVLQARSDPKIWIAPSSDVQNSHPLLEGARIRAEGMGGLASTADGHILYTVKSSGLRTIWEMNRDGGNPHQITPSSNVSNDNQISVTADERFLVFESNRSGGTEIWRADRDGSNLKQLTTGDGNSEPAVSPDGKWVIYTSQRSGKPTLWRVSVEDGEQPPQQLTDEETAWAAISPDGRYIACADGKYINGFHQRIAIIPFEGGTPVKFFPVATNGIMYNRLRWSPDGASLVYKDVVEGLWRQPLNADKPERIKGFNDLRVFHFTWASDGKDLIYSGGVQMREINILESFR